MAKDNFPSQEVKLDFISFSEFQLPKEKSSKTKRRRLYEFLHIILSSSVSVGGLVTSLQANRIAYNLSSGPEVKKMLSSIANSELDSRLNLLDDPTTIIRVPATNEKEVKNAINQYWFSLEPHVSQDNYSRSMLVFSYIVNQKTENTTLSNSISNQAERIKEEIVAESINNRIYERSIMIENSSLNPSVMLPKLSTPVKKDIQKTMSDDIFKTSASSIGNLGSTYYRICTHSPYETTVSINYFLNQISMAQSKLLLLNAIIKVYCDTAANKREEKYIYLCDSSLSELIVPITAPNRLPSGVQYTFADDEMARLFLAISFVERPEMYIINQPDQQQPYTFLDCYTGENEFKVIQLTHHSPAVIEAFGKLVDTAVNYPAKMRELDNADKHLQLEVNDDNREDFRLRLEYENHMREERKLQMEAEKHQMEMEKERWSITKDKIDYLKNNETLKEQVPEVYQALTTDILAYCSKTALTEVIDDTLSRPALAGKYLQAGIVESSKFDKKA